MLNHYNIEGNGNYTAIAGDVDNGVATGAIKQDIEGDTPSNHVTTFTVDYNNVGVTRGTLALQLFIQDFSAMCGGDNFATFQDLEYGEDTFDHSQNKLQKFGSPITYTKDNLAGSDFDLVTGLYLLSDETYQELAQTGRKWVPETKFNNAAPFAQLRFDGF